MIKAVCFDVHDTLIDKGRGKGLAAGKKSAIDALSNKYPHVNEDVYDQARQKSLVKAKNLQKAGREISAHEWYSEQLRHMGIDQINEDLIKEFNQAFMRGFRPYTTVLPGARECLQRLSDSGYRLAAVSNSLGPNTRIDLEITGLIDFFDQIVISSEVGWRKPHPEIFRRVLELLAVEPHEVVFVGDNPNEDIQGALDAGMQAVAIRRTWKKDISPPGGTDASLEQFDLKVPVLDSLFDLWDIISLRI